jgi:hypothetical protein
VTDQEFALRGIVWIGAAWAAGIWAWLWDARRKRTSAGTDAGFGTASQSRHPAATSAATEAARVLPRLRARLATGGEPGEDGTHPVGTTTGPGAGARVGARPAFGGRS